MIVLNIAHPVLCIERKWSWPQILKSWYVYFFQLPWLAELGFARNGAQAIGDLFRDTAVHKTRFPDDVLARYRQWALQPGALKAMIDYYRANFGFIEGWCIPSDRLRALRTPLRTPTLMIWGEQDVALHKSLTLGTERLVEPGNFTLHYLPDASHWVGEDAPDEVNRLIAAWLDARASAQEGRAGQDLNPQPSDPKSDALSN